tara:strand:- start:109339 stop:109755 length:417 start_codon:yes stop_codon:yes gene_type:complete
MKNAILFLFLFFSLVVNSQTVEGTWKTYEDGVLKSEIKLYKKNNKIYGKVVAINNPDDGDYDPICNTCSGNHKNKPLKGMVIIKGLEKDGSEWYADNGVYHPDNDEYYDVRMWLDSNNKLAVRGYLGWFFQTRYWVRK